MKRNKHSLSNYKLLTCNQGQLVPIGLTEVLPGDSIQQATSALIRVSPLLAPVMHPVHVRIHHWFVPHRLVWEDWEDFITGGPTGNDASVFPTITMPAMGGAAIGSLADYLGVTPGVNSLEVNALPFRGYAKIWNEWYRDQDLETELTIDETSGPDSTTNTTLQNVCWEKDYYTSSRAFAQKGAAVTLPLGSSAPVKFDTNDHSSPVIRNSTTHVAFNSSGLGSDGAGTFIDEASGTAVQFDPSTSLYTDLGSASSATVNQLREAFALQRYAEARAKYGSRYTEYLRYLGVRSSDARLQRPEYLGGGKQTIQFSEVLQTAGVTNDEGDPVGNVGSMKGHGIAAMRSNRYRRFFEEHGYIYTFISIKPKTMYAQGLARTWNRRTREDFFQKELQHIGQQEVLYKEVYAGHSTPNERFGYQDRYDEYRRTESSIAGEFRPSGGLEHWHMARIFSGDPALNAAFVKANPTDRIYASTATDQIYVMASHSIQARRMVSKIGGPTFF